MNWLWFFAGFVAFPIVYLLIALTPWHYLIPDRDGSPVLLELELTEPSLFLIHDDRAAGRLASAIAARIA